MKNKYSNMNDAELYYCLSGNQMDKEAAFSEIYSRHSQRVYLYCRRLIGSKEQAEDLFQETFLSLLGSTQKTREMTNLPGFIIKIARNLYLKLRRDNKAIFITIDDLEIGFEDNHLDRKELTEILTSSLALLPDEYREALVLQTYNGMTYEEIADFMEVPVTTIRNWIVRSKKKIREILIHYWEFNTIK